MALSWRPPLKVQFTTTRDEGKLTGVYGRVRIWRMCRAKWPPSMKSARKACSNGGSVRSGRPGEGERLGREGQVHQQQPEVGRGRGAGRGRPRCGRRRSAVARSRRPCAAGPSPCRPRSPPRRPRPPSRTRPARPASAAWAQAVSNHYSPGRDGSPLPELDRPSGVGRGAGGVAQVAAGQAAAAIAPGQVVAVPRRPSGTSSDQRLADGDGPLAAVAGLGGAAEAAEHDGEVGVARAPDYRGIPRTFGLSSASFWQIASALRYSASASDGRPVCASRTPRLLWLSARHCAEFGDGGVLVGQLPADRQRLAVLGLRLRRPARSATAGCRGCCGCPPGAAEFGDGGVVVGQLLVDRQRLAVLGLRLRRPAGLRQQDAEVVVAARQAAAEFGDGGVVVGQLLLDRQRPAVLGLRLRRPARLRQQDAEAVVAVRQAAAEFGDGGVVVGQLLLESPAPGGTRPPPPPACPSRDSRVPRLLWLFARRLRNSVTAGLSSASFCRIASAGGTRPPPPPAGPSATAGCRGCCGWLARISRMFGDGGASLRPAFRRSPPPGGTRPPPPPACPSPPAAWRGCGGYPPGWLRNSVTAGWSSASFCRIASAWRYSASASAGLPVCAAGCRGRCGCPPGRCGSR